MHLETERVQRFLADELSAEDARAARAHVAGCGECARAVEEAQRDRDTIEGLLRRLDHDAPPVSVEALIESSAGRRASKARASRGTALRWAAVVLLAFGTTGVVYALPGSPLREWLGGVLGRDGVFPPVESEGVGAPEVILGGGISVPPGDRLVIVIANTHPDRTVRVSLSDDPEATIRALSGVVSFSSEPDRIVVENGDPTADLAVTVPRDAPSVEIRVGDLVVFSKTGASITSAVEAVVGGAYTIPIRGR